MAAFFFINNPDIVKMLVDIQYRKSLTGSFLIWIHILYLLLKNSEVKLKYSTIYRLMSILSKGIYFFYYSLLKSLRKLQPISKQTLRILKNIDYEYLISSRKKHIKSLYEFFNSENRLSFGRQFDPNFVLTGFPIVTTEKNQKTKDFLKSGIECLSYDKVWLFIPDGQEISYSVEINFYKTHFLLPIHELNNDILSKLSDIII